MKNFRCYTERSFEFPDGNMTLLYGPSGSGKSTILMAIRFALCGSTDRFLVTHAHDKIGKGCEVTLEIDNFKVVRTKQPNILTVQTKIDGTFRKYQGAEAQAVLNTSFGLSAFKHGDTARFLEMSNLEKLDFLEKIAMSDYDVKDLKNRIKNEAVEIAKELATVEGAISQTETILDIFQKPRKVDKPVAQVDIDELVQLSERELETVRIETAENLATARRDQMTQVGLAGRIASLNKEANAIESTGSEAKELTEIDGRIRDLEVEATSLKMAKLRFEAALEAEDELEKMYRNVCDSDVRSLQAELAAVEASISIHSAAVDMRELAALKADLFEQIERETAEWRSKTFKIESDIREIEDVVGGEDSKRLERLRYRIADAEKFLADHEENAVKAAIRSLESAFFKTYKCSDCGSRITINMNTFLVVDFRADVSRSERETGRASPSSVRSELADLTETLRQIETFKLQVSTVPSLDEIEGKISLLKRLKKLKKRSSEMTTLVLSESVEELRRRVRQLQIKVSAIDSVVFEELEKGGGPEELAFSLESLKDERFNLKVKLNQEIDRLAFKDRLLATVKAGKDYDAERHSTVTDDLAKLTESRTKLAVAVERAVIKERLLREAAALSDEMNSIGRADDLTVSLLEKRREEIQRASVFADRLNEYKQFQKNLKKYKDLKSNLKGLEDRKQTLTTLYSTIMLFKQKVVESEHESLDFIVSLVNSHMAMFLTDFFPDGFGSDESSGIQCRLHLESDGRRPQVVAVVNYKGGLVDHKSLSTGEYARLSLALDVAFKDILSESIIMLDERTANLDEDLSSVIFQKIKRTFPTKTILVVAHQASLGCFDHSVHL